MLCTSQADGVVRWIMNNAEAPVVALYGPARHAFLDYDWAMASEQRYATTNPDTTIYGFNKRLGVAPFGRKIGDALGFVWTWWG